MSQADLRRFNESPEFLEELQSYCSSYIAPLVKVAFSKAAGGDGDMLKFMLSAFDPDRFDFAYRRAKLSAQGIESFFSHLMTDEEATIALKDNPILGDKEIVLLPIDEVVAINEDKLKGEA